MSQPDARPEASLPELAAHPKVDLFQGETPLERLENLGRRLGIALWAKRDDCNGLAMGGNKVRQLEYYLGLGAAEGADTVLITGALQSNFVRLTAAAARRLGWQPVVQLEDRVPNDDIFYRTSGNFLLAQLLGAHIHHFPQGEDEAAADRNLVQIAQRLRDEGRRPYVIHLGIEHPPVGGLGYVEAALETRRQLQRMGQEISHVVIPSGSGLTHAGFLVGARAIGWQVTVLGVCVRRDAVQQHQRVLRRAREIVGLLGIGLEIAEQDVIVDDIVLAPGYGRINEPTRAAISLAAESEALLLDPVYSGRCMAGLVHFVEHGRIPTGSEVLFLHTGGTPAIFAYQNDLSLPTNESTAVEAAP
ncbi:MAG: D-cysteine desulfhydrase family protein [Alphaproteobacteria bacterium]|nr:D-cysteine desulfhydrase family protein [Alphaproteobacteria bacterium]